MNLRSLYKNKHSGFTLVEVLVALAITALIMGPISAVVVQTFWVNERGTNNTLAYRQVQMAGQYISEDILQAGETSGSPNVRNVDIIGTAEVEAIWLWWDYSSVYPGGGKHKIRYFTQPDTTTPRVDDYILVRQDFSGYSNFDDWTNPTSTITVAHSIMLPIVFNTATNQLTITATVGSGPRAATETRIYRIDLRIGT